MIRELLDNYRLRRDEIYDLEDEIELIEFDIIRLKNKDITVEEIEEIISSCTPSYSGMPSGTGTSDKTFDDVDKLLDYEEKREKAVRKAEKNKKQKEWRILNLRKQKEKADRIIDTQHNEKMLILHKKYREGKTCQEIADEIPEYYSSKNAVDVALSRLIHKLELEERTKKETI